MLMTAVSLVRHKELISVRIIGEGDFSQALRRLIKSLKLEAIVDFDNQSYPVSSIPGQIEDCHVGLVPLEISSVTDYALPLKLLEYISLGLPVVSVRNKAISYYFSEEDCIFIEWDDRPIAECSLGSALPRIQRFLKAIGTVVWSCARNSLGPARRKNMWHCCANLPVTDEATKLRHKTSPRNHLRPDVQ